MANSAQKSIIVLMGERFDVLRVEFGPAGRANELSLEDFRLLSDRDANVLVERIDDFLVKAELLRMRGNHADSGTTLLHRFSSFILYRSHNIMHHRIFPFLFLHFPKQFIDFLLFHSDR